MILLIQIIKKDQANLLIQGKIKVFYQHLEEVTKEGKALGFDVTYASFPATVNGVHCNNRFGDNAKDNYDNLLWQLASSELRPELVKVDQDIPTEEAVKDEIELLSISKEFDLDSFLEKYNNL